MDIKKLCPGCMNERDGEVCPICGYERGQEDEKTHALLPETILAGKYLVGRVMGEGGFGITYIGYDLNLEVKIAIKEFFPYGYAIRDSQTTSTLTEYSKSDPAQFEKWKESFVREARNLAKFYELPGIVHVRDYFQENNTAYIIMEFVAGETLKDYLKRAESPLGVPETLEMMRPVIRSLSKVHAAGVIHRDISPDNLMIKRDGDVKLIDFGAAREFEEGNERSLSVMLKPGYAPEEQYRTHGEQGPWTDVYALCATIYRCITGIKPAESMERMRKDTLKSPKELGVVISDEADSAIMDGMAVFAEDRIRSMEELYGRLYMDGQKNASALGSVDSIEAVSKTESGQKSNKAGSNKTKDKAARRGVKLLWIFVVAVLAVAVTLIVVLLITGVFSGYSVNNFFVEDGDTESSAVVSAVTNSVENSDAGNVSAENINNPVIADGKSTWDCIWFGRYWQEDTNGDGHCFMRDTVVSKPNNSNYNYDQDKRVLFAFEGEEGNYYADAKQPLKWRVLEVDDKFDALLISDKLIEKLCYEEKSTIKNSTWEFSTLRSFLNCYGAASNSYQADYSSYGFLFFAFNDEERNVVLPSAIANNDTFSFGEGRGRGGNGTNDKIFCLSVEEAENEKYGFTSFDKESSQRSAVATMFAYEKPMKQMKHLIVKQNNDNKYWLRSPGHYNSHAMFVTSAGKVFSWGHRKNGFIFVRPALRINLKAASPFWRYAGTVSSDGTVDEIPPE